MKINLLLFFINFFILNGNPNLLISLEVVEADDCISRVYIIGSGENLYSKDISNPNVNCNHDKQLADADKVIVDSKPYEIGKKVVAVLHDRGGGSGNEAAIGIIVYLNEYIIKFESRIFWSYSGFS